MNKNENLMLTDKATSKPNNSSHAKEILADYQKLNPE